MLRVFGARVAALLLLCAIALALSLQGWRSRELSPLFTDLVTQIMAADSLLRTGHIPEIGGVSSFFGRIPPGQAWLLVPGVLMFDDPRLFAVPGSAILLLLTVIGIVLAGRALYSERLGWIAASLYAISPFGLFYASSLWPRGHPAFVIWTLILVYLAIARSQGAWLMVAAAVFSAGTYVYIEIAPLAIVFLVVAFQKPKLLAGWVLPAMIMVSLFIWFPYLRFESSVNFVDVVRMVGSNATVPGDAKWCGEAPRPISAVTGEPFDIRAYDHRWPPKPRDSSRTREIFEYRMPATLNSLVRSLSLSKWEKARSDTIFNSLLFSLLVLGATLCLVATRPASAKNNDARWIEWFMIRSACAMGLLLLVLEVMRLSSTVVPWQRIDSLYLTGVIVFLTGFGMAVRLIDDHSLTSLVGKIRSRPPLIFAVLLLLSFVVGQVSWSLVSPLEERRFWWLWPLECVFIALALVAYSQWRAVRWLNLLLVCSVFAGLGNFAVRYHIRDWYAQGWHGQELPIIKLLDRLVEHRKVNGKSESGVSVSISYDILAEPFNLAASSVDSRYSLGMAYDTFAKYKYGLQQELLCADSYSKNSRYLIREERGYGWGDRLWLHSSPIDSEQYVFLGREGRFSLFWRP